MEIQEQLESNARATQERRVAHEQVAQIGSE